MRGIDMRPYKVIIIIVLFMLVYTLFMVPISEGTFPGWMNADLVQFFLVMLCIACVIVLMRN